MSFRFVNLPLWIILCVLLSVYLIYTGVKRRRIDKRGLVVTYFAAATIGLFAALYRLIDEVYIQYKQYNEYIFYTIIGMLVVVFLNIVFLAVMHKGNERSRRLIKIAFLIILISSIPIAILIILDMLGVVT